MFVEERQVSLAATEQSENLLDLYFWEVNTVYTSGQSRVQCAVQCRGIEKDQIRNLFS